MACGQLPRGLDGRYIEGPTTAPSRPYKSLGGKSGKSGTVGLLRNPTSGRPRSLTRKRPSATAAVASLVLAARSSFGQPQGKKHFFNSPTVTVFALPLCRTPAARPKGVLLGKTFLGFRGQRKLTFCRNRNTLPGSSFSPGPKRPRPALSGKSQITSTKSQTYAAEPRVDATRI